MSSQSTESVLSKCWLRNGDPGKSPFREAVGMKLDYKKVKQEWKMSLGDSEKRHFFLRLLLEKSMDENGIS